MKKIFIVLFAMQFWASFLWAQNVSTTNQTGDYNEATIQQVGSNTSTVTQTSISPGSVGKANEATVNQSGQGNSSTLTQDRSGGQQTHRTKATITQTGDNNNTTVLQDGHYQGSNTVIVTQSGISGGVGNIADVHQQGYGNNWTINQTGDDNKAYQYATSTVHSGTTNLIEQDGLSNTAYQYTSGSDAMRAEIHQVTGVSGNFAEQRQAGLKAQAFIYQYSNDNQAYQEQYHGSYKFNGVYARQHLAEITQTGGDGNYAQQYQDENIADVWANSRNESTIYQEGAINSSTVLQYDGLNLGNVSQIGDNNLGNITQNTIGNTATVTQTGDNNIATVTQN